MQAVLSSRTTRDTINIPSMLAENQNSNLEYEGSFKRTLLGDVTVANR